MFVCGDEFIVFILDVHSNLLSARFKNKRGMLCMSRVNKVAKKESFGFECKRSEYIQDLTVNIHDMSAESLNI